MRAEDLVAALQKHAAATDVEFLPKFFKTGEGDYGAGDVFIGVRVPQTRAVCKQFKDLPLPEIQKLFDSPIHECRLAAVILLSDRYPKANAAQQDKLFDLYLHNVRIGRVNNWDLVDASAEFIIGPHEQKTDRALLFELAHSSDIWQKRTSILSAFCYVKQGQADTTLQLAEILLHDKHDLIQKAVGWQLREVGKRADRAVLLKFLDKHAAVMPRTTLRYAIEHLTPEQRAHYMQAAKTANN
jgi:3-methyladenine DNA glycosylase AlkD